jgi:hypothetical protein
MTKPSTIDGYSEQVTHDCERVLVTILRNLGPWRDSIFLVGGMTPRYLVRDRPPVVPAHAGTLDLDIVVDVVILEDTEAYRTLEQNLTKIGFKNATNTQGKNVTWRWKVRMEDGSQIILELLTDRQDTMGGRVKPLPIEGNISALNVPHSSMVFDLHDTIDVTAELLDGNGTDTQTVRYANIVSFVCLKALAFDQRAEPKDAHDLVYCVENIPGGWEAAAREFRAQIEGKHKDIIRVCLVLLRKHFVGNGQTDAYRLNGPTMVAKFEEGEEDAGSEKHVLRQRQVADVMEAFAKGADIAEESGISTQP